MSKVAPREPSDGKLFYDLAGFARLFIRTHTIRSHKDVRTELLVEAFRHHMGLSPFPTLEQLTDLCGKLEIELGDLPKGSELPGANTTFEGSHAIFLQRNLPKHFSESTAGHEIREVIERAFQLAAASYQGLDTSNNAAMHGESEFFALCLLMQAEGTHTRLSELGFDVVRFSEEKGRSLPSVIKRVQTIYGRGSQWPGPVAGLWLFEGPAARSGDRPPNSFRAKHRASLCGFSTDKNGSAYAKVANHVFPKPKSSASDFAPACAALTQREPVLETVSLGDLLGLEDYLVLAEPLLRKDSVSRIMVSASRRDCDHFIQPLIERLGQLARA